VADLGQPPERGGTSRAVAAKRSLLTYRRGKQNTSRLNRPHTTSLRSERSSVVGGRVALCAGVWRVSLSRRPAIPSLPRDRVGMESVAQLPHLQGCSLAADRSFAENRGHVRPPSPVAATVEREEARICRSFSKPPDG